jgi:hypothetical protein
MSVFDLNLEDLIKENPKVDPELIREAADDLQKLRDSGLPGPEYNIESAYDPFARRAVS